MRLTSKINLRNRKGERYGRTTLSAGRTKLISGKTGWAQIFKKTIRGVK